jgi:hypothetical protein
MDQQRREADEAAPDQTSGQADDAREAANPAESGDPITGYSEGTPTTPDDPSPLARDEEGMDR